MEGLKGVSSTFEDATGVTQIPAKATRKARIRRDSNLKSGGGLSMSTVVIFSEMVFSSASKYRSMKYSWQKRQAPFLRPSMVDALMISSISGMLVSPSIMKTVALVVVGKETRWRARLRIPDSF